MSFNLRKQNNTYSIRYKDGIAYIYYGDAVINNPNIDCSSENGDIVYMCSSYFYNPLLTVGWDSSYCNSSNTHAKVLPVNNYLQPQVKSPPSDAYNYICNNNYYISISNKIKITITDDEIFNGTYVFDYAPGYGDSALFSSNWVLNNNESTHNLNLYNHPDSPFHNKLLVSFDDNSQSNIIGYEGYLEFKSSYYNDENNTGAKQLEDVYAFPAEFVFTAVQPPLSCSGIPDVDLISTVGSGHRLAVGFSPPIRWRHPYNNWVVVDKISHNINNSIINYATGSVFNNGTGPYYSSQLDETVLLNNSKYIQYTESYIPGTAETQIGNGYVSLNMNDPWPVCTGLNDLGFAFRCSASGLGIDRGLSYYYDGHTIQGIGRAQEYLRDVVDNWDFIIKDERPFFDNKIPVNATIDFIYSCRSGLPCMNLQGTSIPPSSVTGVGCLSLNSFIDIDYWCNDDKAFPSDYDWTGGSSPILSTQIIFSGVSGMNPLVVSAYAGDTTSNYVYDAYINYDEFPLINIPYTGYLPSQIRNFLTNKFHVVNFNKNPYTDTWIPSSIHKQYPNLDLYWETDIDNQSAKVYVIADEAEYRSPIIIISGAGTSSVNGTYDHIGYNYDIYNNAQYFRNLSNNSNFYIFLTTKGWTIQKFQGNAWVPYYRASGVNILSNTYSRAPYYQTNWSTGICLSGAAPAPISKSYYY